MSQRLTILFTTTPRAIAAARRPSVAEGAAALVVELSARPGWVFTLGLQTPADFPGIAGLLAPGSRWEDLVVKPDPEGPSYLPSAGTPVPAAVLGAGLSTLRAAPNLPQPCVVTIPVDEAEDLLPWLRPGDRIGFVQEADAPPPRAAEPLLRSLAAEGLLSPSTWLGLRAAGPSSEPSWGAAWGRLAGAHPGVVLAS